MTFSARLPDRLQPNAVSVAVETLRASGTPLVDLTESNPTRVGLPYPAGLLASLSGPRALLYEPAPLGLWSHGKPLPPTRGGVARVSIRRMWC